MRVAIFDEVGGVAKGSFYRIERDADDDPAELEPPEPVARHFDKSGSPRSLLFMPRLALLLVGLSLLLGCRRSREAEPISVTDAGPRRPAPAAALSAWGAPSASGRPPDRPPRVLTAQESKRYQAALGRGRLATQRKDWKTACTAFDEALALMPEDPRAEAERGYARLLSGDLVGANKDLRDAQGHSSDRKLEAQIWFNIGLVAEKSESVEEARTAFARSVALNPTTSAQRKLEGESLCTVQVDRSVVPPRNFPSWREAWRALNDAASEATPADDAAARRALEIETCPIVCVGHTPYTAGWHLFFPLKDGTIDVQRSIGEGNGTRCAGPPAVALVEGSSPVHVVVKNDMVQTDAFCFEENGEYTCRLNCAGPVDWYRTDLFFEVETHRRVLSLSQQGRTAQEKYQDTTRAPKVDAEGVEFDGVGCGPTRVPLPGR
jgi:hypothetical protein